MKRISLRFVWGSAFLKTMSCFAISISLLFLTEQILRSQREDKPQLPQYISKEGGFEFAAAGEVKEESKPRGSGHVGSVTASVNLGGGGSYRAVAGFWPVSLGRREDAEKQFSSLYKSTFSSFCAESRVEVTEVQGLPARLIRASKCGNPPVLNEVSLWVFAGNRLFTFDVYMTPLKHIDAERLVASFKIADPRFINPGEWTAFECSEGGFSVSLLGFPLRQMQATPMGTVYSLENYAYSASSLPPLPGGKPGDTLDKLERMAQEPVHGTVLQRTNLKSGGLSARKLKVSYQNAEGTFINSVFIILGNGREYFLSVTSKQSTPIAQADVDRFFNSFKEIDPKH